LILDATDRFGLLAGRILADLGADVVLSILIRPPPRTGSSSSETQKCSRMPTRAYSASGYHLIEIKLQSRRLWHPCRCQRWEIVLMIICSCNVISDREVEAAFSALATPQTVSQVYQHVGRRPICGRCAHTIRDVLRQSPARRLLADNDCHG
jgi:bacterioferritin-associated ferredoxin